MSTPIEMIKAYHAIKSYLSEQNQIDLIQKLGLTSTDLNIRMKGKDEEIEFILTLFFLNSCKHMIGFEEGVSTLSNTHTPDLLIELNDGNRIFIEIKSTSDDKYKISRGNFNKRVKFAESFGYPLYFAIKIKGLWMLFESSYLEQRNYKIDISNYMYSKFEEITGNRYFMFPKGMKIVSHYSKSDQNHLNIHFEPYGNLVHYSLIFNNKVILTVSSTNKDSMGNLFLLEALQDSMSVQSQTISNSESTDLTRIEEELIQPLTMIDSMQLIHAPINHMNQDNGNITDLNTYFRDLASNKKNLLTIDHFYNLINQLVALGIPILEKRGNNIYRL
ncbi:hypothetical protein MPH47_09815 [Psychrobacillus psychrodurans]|uniref:hypothetical protein n=1 Tax=Psychrobacillus psychrodurans TaxID=126157 RepID=UPI001F4DEC00|nr:hypothetical protein [Psychrobacillus psychrodurans]MCK1997513.1 hypothetical protein [Psychrobacillus psychrodurans]